MLVSKNCIKSQKNQRQHQFPLIITIKESKNRFLREEKMRESDNTQLESMHQCSQG
jgi:predicted transcriptional regulator